MSGYSISLIRDPARGTKRLRVAWLAWTSAVIQTFFPIYFKFNSERFGLPWVKLQKMYEGNPGKSILVRFSATFELRGRVAGWEKRNRNENKEKEGKEWVDISHHALARLSTSLHYTCRCKHESKSLGYNWTVWVFFWTKRRCDLYAMLTIVVDLPG